MSVLERRDPLRVVFFGDSICVGQGVSLFKGWVTKIASELDSLSQEIGREIVVVNASVNGNTTRQALERMPYEVQSHGVDILLTQFGLNDCNLWLTDGGLPRVSADAFAANLKEIIARGRRFGAQKVFLNNNHPTMRHDFLEHAGCTYEENNRRYNQIVRDVAGALGSDVELIDIEEHFRSRIASGATPDSLVLSDGLHLSTSGHDIYFEILAPRLRDAVVGMTFGNARPRSDVAAT